MGNKEFDIIGDILEKYAKQIISKMKEFLIANKKDASGRLLASIRFENIKVSEGNYSLKLLMEDYYINVNDGRGKGKKAPPPKAIKQWIQDRGIRASKAQLDKVGKKRIRGKNKGKAYTKDDIYNSMAFAMSKSISKKGIKSVPFYDIIITDDLLNSIKKEITTELKQEIEISISPN